MFVTKVADCPKEMAPPGRRVLTKSISVSHLDLARASQVSDAGVVRSEIVREDEDVAKPPRLYARASSVNSTPGALSNNNGATTTATTLRKLNPSGVQRGIMEKFLASRGRISSQSTFSNVNNNVNYSTAGSTTSDPVGVVSSKTSHPVPVKVVRPFQVLNPPTVKATPKEQVPINL